MAGEVSHMHACVVFVTQTVCVCAFRVCVLCARMHAQVASRANNVYHPTCAERSIDVMTSWMAENFAAPYPSLEQRRELAEAGGITEKQVVYWFSNARKRTWKVR